MQEYEELQSRLRNCLQTILELEPELEGLELGQDLMKEFDLLKSFMEKLEDVDLQEEDVRRIETATANFLEELKGPLSNLRERSVARRFLH
ncbi:hypothetical protein LN040_02480 [Desulfovibrio subterraneus]|jgi:hypothetical protein|uniref:Uncharacterized protein n=1 Tax=Desulfovibrio subterraneus TaxID=2718620 RepID=A0A7J0BJG1_9BACT|nr:hypothetical protein [Desulfovibrio subterraneus]WBF67996.1 hypothetical protein LN040_02480 [Desulfovibrio subterraneus]GFM33867.1 hypothetical protein DSM101010T_22320 [Desulfovibrio subterraneus]